MECLELALLAPTSSNLQCWEFYWVKNPDKKKKLIDYCLGQPAAKTAQELIVCVARPDNWQLNTEIMLDMVKDKELPKAVSTYYKKIVPLAYMRGRTLNNACIILDEAQNATSGQIKMFLTRLGAVSYTHLTLPTKA